MKIRTRGFTTLIVLGITLLVFGIIMKYSTENAIEKSSEDLLSTQREMPLNPTEKQIEELEKIQDETEFQTEIHTWSIVVISVSISMVIIGIMFLFSDRNRIIKSVNGRETDEDNEEDGDSLYGIVRCYECGKTIPILSRRRPLEVKCLSCGFRGMIEMIAGNETYTKSNPAPLCSPLNDENIDTSNEQDDWIVYENKK